MVCLDSLHIERSKFGELCSALEEQSVRYSVWKSYNRIGESLKGQTDIDLVVHEDDQSLAHEVLRMHGWIKVLAEPWRQYPSVEDFLTYEPKHACLLHLHLHFKLVMGENRVKSLQLPLEEFYLKNSSKNQAGIFVVSPEIELIVFILRCSLKPRTKDLLRFKSSWIYAKFVEEFEALKEGVSKAALEAALQSPELSFVCRELVLKAFDNLLSLNRSDWRKIRASIAPYRRYSAWYAYGVGVLRYFWSKVGMEGKALLEGQAFAFCGPDGSGKSSNLSRVENLVKRHLRVKSFALGSSPATKGLKRTLSRIFLWPIYVVAYRLLGFLKLEKVRQDLRRKYYGLEKYLATLEKCRRYKDSLILLNSGYLVLYDRFPIFDGFGDRMPEFIVFKDSQERLLSEFELPKRVYCFRVEPSDAVSRKSDHDANLVREKVGVFEEYYRRVSSQPEFLVLNTSHLPKEETNKVVMMDMFRMLCNDS